MPVAIGSVYDPNDLAAAVYVALTDEFFDETGGPLPFDLRDKASSQDDPFDEHIAARLKLRLPNTLRVLVSGKPLVSPDLVVSRPEEDEKLQAGGRQSDPRRLLAIEVKKLRAQDGGRASRRNGLDFNSTPPCSTVALQATDGSELRVPAFYLFATLRNEGQVNHVESLALVSGAALNRDEELYNTATGTRRKSIGLGSYGDGMDRQRPMFVFANPLGWSWLSGHSTLIHERPDLEDEQWIVRHREVVRVDREKIPYSFWCYRRAGHGEVGDTSTAIEPFPSSDSRKEETTKRGKFRLAP